LDFFERQKTFGWLTKFTISAGIQLSHKNFGRGMAHAIKFGVAARGGGAWI